MFDWSDLVDKFINVLFAPLLLTIVTYLRMYVIQRPVTITHERIDADELFTEYFEKVVEKVTNRVLIDDKKFVVFVDNLDRLTDDKMVEALESLKTYINNKNCIFVVACDDSVVRSVINKSNKIPGRRSNNNKDNEGKIDHKAGEHYLDKFFQQTFRLPEYMGINLQDFAERNFETTYLHDKLISKNVDIRNLISILLPTDVGSPRKVKRLLNDYIAIYDIVERREGQKEGQLRPGTITSRPEFLAKYSTLRTEHPDFYRLMVADTGFLSELTNLLLDGNEKEVVNRLSGFIQEGNLESLIAYLKKTRTITTDNLGSYIFLSQDTLSLGLRPEHNKQLRAALSNGDIDQFTQILQIDETDDYKELLINIASRIVEHRLVGIEQQNGTKLLAHFLPNFPDNLKPEIAHIVSKLIPQWPLDVFGADDFFHVLKWAHREFGTQRSRLIDHLMGRLQVLDLRTQTFNTFLKNADIIEENRFTARVQHWLADILSYNLQTDVQEVDGDIPTSAVNNIEFGEWLISKIGEYRENEFIIENYFSGSMTEYMFGRILGQYKDIPAISIIEDGLGKSIKEGLLIVETHILAGGVSNQYWEGILGLLQLSGFLYDYQFATNSLRRLMDLIPEQIGNHLFINILIGLNDVIEDVETEKSKEWLESEFSLLSEIRRKTSSPFSETESESVVSLYSKLIKLRLHTESMMNFTEGYTTDFSEDTNHPFLQGSISVFKELGTDLEIALLLLETIIKLDNYLDQTTRQAISETVDTLVMSNNEVYLNNAIEYISLLSPFESYKDCATSFL